MTNRPFIIGITGGSASGKTSFARDLKSSFNDEEVCLISQDHYYKHRNYISRDVKNIRNFDHPDAIDSKTYIDHIYQLNAGNPVNQQENTFYKKGVIPKILVFKPVPVVLIEGIFSIHFDECLDLFKLKIYMEADQEIRLQRRIIRDIDRGFSKRDVMYRWKNHIMPFYESNSQTYKRKADIIILNNTNYNVALDMLTGYVRNIILKS